MKKIAILFITLCALHNILIAQTKQIVYTHATIHVGNTQVVTNGTLAIKNGKIIVV